jgi:RNA-directed DNA polymerase
VRHHTDRRWTLLYIERWLTAPVEMEDGSLHPRGCGTPQGGVISPVLANLFLHYAFDMWMRRAFPAIPFERYADDVICHCRTQAEAERLKAALDARLAACGLALHPEKTRVVYCRDTDRPGDHPVHKFTFLGYEFRPRLVRWKAGQYRVGFTPAVGPKALKAIRTEVRRWRLHRRTDKELADLARMFNPIIRGWILYYGKFHRSALYPALRHIDLYLGRWACKKLKRHRGRQRRAHRWLAREAQARPRLFAHWSFLRGSGWATRAV